MGFKGDFNDVRFDGSELSVTGKSVPPIPQQIYVMLERGGALLSDHIDVVADAVEWTATFPNGEPPFEVGKDVFVIGMAMRPEPHDPFVWQGSLTIQEP